MGSTQTSKNGRGEKKYDFTPVEFDTNKIEPEAAAGKYKARIADVEVMATKKDGYPMIRIDWKLLKALTDDEACEKSEGAQVSDYIAMFPDGDRRGNMAKRRFRALRELLDLSDDILPTRIESKSDFNDLLKALKKAEAEVFIQVREDKETKEERANVSYTAPKGMMDDVEEEDEEEDEEEEEEEEDEEEADEEEEEEDEEPESERKPSKKSKKGR